VTRAAAAVVGVAGDARVAEIGVVLAAGVEGLSATGASRLTGAAVAAMSKPPWSVLHRHLSAHPDAARSGSSQVPPVVLAVIWALHDAGYQVVLPACRRCGRPNRRLPLVVTGGRACGSCAKQLGAWPCSRCGQAKPVRSHDEHGPVCQACHAADPATWTVCCRCGQTARLGARTPDGAAVCRRCYEHGRRLPCTGCGRTAPVAGRGPGGPVCQRCRTRPAGACDRCGRVEPLNTRRTATGQALCRTCRKQQDSAVACAVCGQLRSCRATPAHGGQRVCAECQPDHHRACVYCGRTRRIYTTWPLGAVCGTCYARTRGQPGACADCGDVAPLIGRRPDGGGLCPACSGRPERTYTCRRCRQTGYFYTAGCCPRCQASDRVRQLLAVHNGHIAADLAPLADALAASDSPPAVLQWLAPGQPAAGLLAQLAGADEPVSHDLLDRLGPGLAVHRLRQTLVHTAVLPERADYLERLVPWLDTLLTGHPPARAHLIRTYTQWTLLRRARRRARTGRFTPGSGNWLRTQVRAVVNLLTWLENNQLTLHTVSQDQLNAWLIARPTDATYRARQFLTWARRHHLAGDVSIPKKQPRSAMPAITEDQRWTQLARCLREDSLPTEVRAAGALVLLYGLPVSRISDLAVTDLRRHGDRTSLAIGGHDLPLPPAVAALLHTQADTARRVSPLDRTSAEGTRWLFPGGFPGRPARDALYRGLRRHLPVHLRQARSAALINLAATIPAAVLADLLDISIHTANTWAEHARHDWASYLAARTTAGSPGA
jgi:hypothetical protein